MQPYSPSPGKKGGAEPGKFKIDITDAQANQESTQNLKHNESSQDPMRTPAKGTGSRAELGNVLLPKPRAAGGIWLN